MRRLLALSLLLSSLALGGAAGLAAPAALAAGSGATTQPNFSLTNGGATPTPQTTTATPVATTSSSSGLSSADAAIIVVVGVLVLGGIAFWIWYDARGHAARVGHGHDDGLFGQRAHAGSKTPRKPRKLTPAERKRRKRGRAR